MNIDKWFELNTHDLSDINIAITGSTGGLGREISLHLARLNANLIFLNRNPDKSKQIAKEICSIYPKTKIIHIGIDLENMDSVKSCIEDLTDARIDILILNAGIYNVPLKTLESGYNNIFQTNFLSQYNLAKGLLPNLSKSKMGKIVAVSSIAHNYSKIDTKDIDFSTRKQASKIYGNSKRFLTFALQELVKDSKVKLSLVHPGITLTSMTNHYPKAINWLVKIGIKLLFQNPRKASLNIVKGIFEDIPYNSWIGPKIFNIWGKPAVKKLKTATDIEIHKIFEITQNIT